MNTLNGGRDSAEGSSFFGVYVCISFGLRVVNILYDIKILFCKGASKRREKGHIRNRGVFFGGGGGGGGRGRCISLRSFAAWYRLF